MHRRTIGAATGIAVAATLLTAMPATATGARIDLPALSGHHPVGTTELHLVDRNRSDPWVAGTSREVMATVTYPSTGSGDRAPWMTPGIADAVDAITSGPYFFDVPRGSVDWGSVRRHARSAAPVDRGHGDWPVVLFSPGFGSARELNAGLTDDLASRGYVVVSLSHTHESAAVEFPGGRVEYGLVGDEDLPGRKTAIDARVADTRFVLDELARLDRGDNPDAERDPLPRGLVGALDLSRVGMFGHSYGGYTAGETMVQDRRIDAGVNVDGAMGHGRGVDPYLPGEVVKRGLDRPFLLVGGDFVDPGTGARTEHSHLERAFDPTWADFWPRQRGWKRDLHLDGSTHYGFTDLQVVVPQLDSLLPPATRTALIGTIDPARSLAVQHDYLAAFFDLHLKRRHTRLFDRDAPDVRFL
ncbi:MAG TPA: lipase [Umezawaea sp.]|nr:lipase [Umezawaea sp.]